MKAINIFDSIPETLNAEVFEDILKLPGLRIERIISKGQSTPEDAWYDQEEGEWIILLEGGAILEFENAEYVTLKKGDYLNIAAHRKHKVKWTDPTQISIWLAIFLQRMNLHWRQNLFWFRYDDCAETLSVKNHRCSSHKPPAATRSRP